MLHDAMLITFKLVGERNLQVSSVDDQGLTLLYQSTTKHTSCEINHTAVVNYIKVNETLQTICISNCISNCISLLVAPQALARD